LPKNTVAKPVAILVACPSGEEARPARTAHAVQKRTPGEDRPRRPSHSSAAKGVDRIRVDLDTGVKP